MKILLAILALWSIIGLIFYWTMFNKTIRKTPQKIVMHLLSGPIVFGLLPLILLMDFVSEKVLEPLYKWLQE